MSSTPNQFDEWYDDDHGTSIEDELDEDANELDTGTYNSQWNQL